MGAVSGSGRLLKASVAQRQAPKILQITGFKNSGKTPLTERLLRQAQELGWKTSVIKHHGHGGTPEPPPSGTDASRFFGAGAASSIVSGGGTLLLQGRHPQDEEGELEGLIALTEAYARPDLILIEGYKEAEYPKVVLLRSEEDWTKLSGLVNIGLIVALNDGLIQRLKKAEHREAPGMLTRDRTEELAAWFAGWLKGDNPDETL